MDEEVRSVAELLHVIELLTSELEAERLAHLEAERRNTELQERISGLTLAVSELTAKVGELSARLGADSSNSSRPPSSDGPGVKPRSLRRSSGRRPGRAAGHEGSTLEMVAVPDFVHEHRPGRCGGCGHRFTAGQMPVGAEARQVFDLPADLRLEVTEHQIQSLACQGCGKVTKATAPGGVCRQVQYGPGISALAVHLVQGATTSPWTGPLA